MASTRFGNSLRPRQNIAINENQKPPQMVPVGKPETVAATLAPSNLLLRKFGAPVVLNLKPNNALKNADPKQNNKIKITTKFNGKDVENVGTGKPVISKIPRISVIHKIEEPEPEPMQVQQDSFSTQSLPLGVENIDKHDDNNVLLATDYVVDIYNYMRSLEVALPIRKDFLSVQREMTPKMRTVLVDWLINVHHQFRLLPETLYMGVSLMDRFFQREMVNKDKIQLVGVTAFFIACKFEEIYPPDLQDFVVICDKLYNRKEIIKMEMAMLRVLKFELARPLPLHFLRRNSKAAHADPRIHTMAKYLMEITLLDHECASWAPSLVAATGLYITLKLFSDSEEHFWNDTIAYYSGYSETELLPNVAHVCRYLRKNELSKFENCRKKYASTKLMAISKCWELQSSIIDELAAQA